MVDIGLLGVMLQLDEETMLSGSQYFGQYKGAFTEQFVLQEMKALSNVPIYYWSPEASIAEVDFVVQSKAQVIPIEVKAERNLRAKSLGMFVNKYSSKTAIRTSLQAYEEGNTIVDVPLYGFAWYFLSLL